MAPSGVLEVTSHEAERLRAQIEPLELQLRRCDELVQRLDAATAERDAAMAEFDKAAADHQIFGSHADAPNPHEFNMREIALRQAQHLARAALKARPGIAGRLQTLRAQLDQLERQCDEATWLALPSAAAHLFSAAEAAQREYQKALCRIDSVAEFASQRGHLSANGGDWRGTPAGRAWQQLAGMVATLTSALGSNAVRDFTTGPALHDAIVDGTAQCGDISQWMPRPQRAGVEDGSKYINRGNPDAAPLGVVVQWPNPAVDPDGNMWRFHPNPAPSGGER
jgi:hypothetical protein